MSIQIGPYQVGQDQPLLVIAGPCVIESESLVLEIAHQMKEITSELGLPYIFKASFDKANRSSLESFRGQGRAQGLSVLQKVKDEVGVPVITDIHDVTMIEEVAKVVDVLQIPAFLCRQTDLLLEASKTQRAMMIKKGQFLSPQEMKHVLAKAKSTGNASIMLCERGSSFGYHNLVVDMRSFEIMGQMAPVIFDATHSVQLPGQQDGRSGGQREYVPVLARAAVAAGVSGVFLETHPNPDEALSDGPNSMPLAQMKHLLETLKNIHHCVQG